MSFVLEHVQTFLQRTLGEWQSKNWDPKVGSPVFDEYCAALNHPFAGLLYVVDYGLITQAEVRKLLAFPGVSFALFNYAKYVRDVRFFRHALL